MIFFPLCIWTKEKHPLLCLNYSQLFSTSTTSLPELTSCLPAPAAFLGQLWQPAKVWFLCPCFWKSSIILHASSCFHSGWQRYLPVIPQCSLSSSTFPPSIRDKTCCTVQNTELSLEKFCLLENQTKQLEMQSLVSNTVFQKYLQPFLKSTASLTLL